MNPWLIFLLFFGGVIALVRVVVRVLRLGPDDDDKVDPSDRTAP
jgi:hypothetical protein